MVMLVSGFGQWGLFSERHLLDELDVATIVFLDSSEDGGPGQRGRVRAALPWGWACSVCSGDTSLVAD